MKYLTTLIVFVSILAIFSVLFLKANEAEANQAQVTASVLCNNDNFQHSARCSAPVDLETLTSTSSSIYGKRDWYGTLTSGVQFSQVWIGSETMKFQAEDMRWFITRYGIVYY